MRFTLPDVIMVFSNNYPNTSEFSEDRWNIFKINKDMKLKDVTVSQLKKRKKNTGPNNKYRYNQAQYYDSD